MQHRFPVCVAAFIGFVFSAQMADGGSDLRQQLTEAWQKIQDCENLPKGDLESCQALAKLRIDLISAEISQTKLESDSRPNWSLEFLKVLLAAAGGAIGALVGLWAERRKVIAGIEARGQELDKILKEVRLTQEIQIKMAGGEWDRQSLWRERRDSYAKLIVAGEAVMNMLYAGRDHEQSKWSDLSLADSYARIFCNKACVKALNEFWKKRDQVNEQKSFQDQADEAHEFVLRVLDAAKNDLRAERVLEIPATSTRAIT
jgi:hypothetical protein